MGCALVVLALGGPQKGQHGLRRVDWPCTRVTCDTSSQMTNKAANTMFGYKKTELRGKNVNVLIPPPFAENHNSFGEYC